MACSLIFIRGDAGGRKVVGGHSHACVRCRGGEPAGLYEGSAGGEWWRGVIVGMVGGRGRLLRGRWGGDGARAGRVRAVKLGGVGIQGVSTSLAKAHQSWSASA